MANKQTMTQKDASRIQSNADKQGGKKAEKGSFKTRTQRSATKNQES